MGTKRQCLRSVFQDSSILLSGSSDTRAIAWELNGNHKYILSRYNNRVLSVAISRNSRWVLIGSASDVAGAPTLILWDLLPFFNSMSLSRFLNDMYGELFINSHMHDPSHLQPMKKLRRQLHLNNHKQQ